MNATQIIAQDLTNRGKHVHMLMKGITAQIAKGDRQLFQSHNTVMTIKDLGQHEGAVHIFTVDSPLMLVKALADIEQHLKKIKLYHTIYGKVSNAQMIRTLRLAGFHIVHSNKQKYNCMARL